MNSISSLDPHTKVDPAWPLLLELRERGWSAADAWLRGGRAARSTVPPKPANIGSRSERESEREPQERRTA
jgi:hypothetical protein